MGRCAFGGGDIVTPEQFKAYRELNDHYLARAILQLCDENRDLRDALRDLTERVAAIECPAAK
jgi:hypothetical protein